MPRFLSDSWFIASRDLVYLLRQKETILWVFLMPFVFFYFIGSVTSGFSGGAGTGTKTVIAMRVADDSGFLADELQTRLEEQDFVVRRPDANSDAEYAYEDYTRRIELPAVMTEQVLSGEGAEVSFRRRGAGINTELDAFKVKRATYTVLADVLALTSAADDGALPQAADFAALHAMPRSLSVDVSSAGTRKVPPSGFEQAIPGIMVMFTLLILLTNGATALVIERREGLLRRLASAPLSRASIVAGKWAAKLFLGMVQIAFAMLVGSLVFKVSWGSNLAMVLLVMLAYAAMLSSLGILLGSLLRTEGQAVGVGVLTANLFAALGGCWWPIEITPPFMQTLSLFLPTGWTMDALHQLVNFGADASVAVPHVLGMTACAVLLGWVATRQFRFE